MRKGKSKEEEKGDEKEDDEKDMEDDEDKGNEEMVGQVDSARPRPFILPLVWMVNDF